MTVNPSDTRWFKSSYSQAGGECVEVAFLATGSVGIRDSKDPTGPALIFAPHEWATFTTHLTGGDFDPQRA